MRMKTTHSSSTKTKPVNVTLYAQDVALAKEYGINVSQVARDSLREALRAEYKRRYLDENKEAIAEHNAWVEKHGVLITPMWLRDDVTF